MGRGGTKWREKQFSIEALKSHKFGLLAEGDKWIPFDLLQVMPPTDAKSAEKSTNPPPTTFRQPTFLTTLKLDGNPDLTGRPILELWRHWLTRLVRGGDLHTTVQAVYARLRDQTEAVLGTPIPDDVDQASVELIDRLESAQVGFGLKKPSLTFVSFDGCPALDQGLCESLSRMGVRFSNLTETPPPKVQIAPRRRHAPKDVPKKKKKKKVVRKAVSRAARLRRRERAAEAAAANREALEDTGSEWEKSEEEEKKGSDTESAKEEEGGEETEEEEAPTITRRETRSSTAKAVAPSPEKERKEKRETKKTKEEEPKRKTRRSKGIEEQEQQIAQETQRRNAVQAQEQEHQREKQQRKQQKQQKQRQRPILLIPVERYEYASGKLFRVSHDKEEEVKDLVTLARSNREALTVIRRHPDLLSRVAGVILSVRDRRQQGDFMSFQVEIAPDRLEWRTQFELEAEAPFLYRRELESLTKQQLELLEGASKAAEENPTYHYRLIPGDFGEVYEITPAGESKVSLSDANDSLTLFRSLLEEGGATIEKVLGHHISEDEVKVRLRYGDRIMDVFVDDSVVSHFAADKVQRFVEAVQSAVERQDVSFMEAYLEDVANDQDLEEVARLQALHSELSGGWELQGKDGDLYVLKRRPQSRPILVSEVEQFKQVGGAVCDSRQVGWTIAPGVVARSESKIVSPDQVADYAKDGWKRIKGVVVVQRGEGATLEEKAVTEVPAGWTEVDAIQMEQMKVFPSDAAIPAGWSIAQDRQHMRREPQTKYVTYDELPRAFRPSRIVKEYENYIEYRTQVGKKERLRYEEFDRLFPGQRQRWINEEPMPVLQVAEPNLLLTYASSDNPKADELMQSKATLNETGPIVDELKTLLAPQQPPSTSTAEPDYAQEISEYSQLSHEMVLVEGGQSKQKDKQFYQLYFSTQELDDRSPSNYKSMVEKFRARAEADARARVASPNPELRKAAQRYLDTRDLEHFYLIAEDIRAIRRRGTMTHPETLRQREVLSKYKEMIRREMIRPTTGGEIEGVVQSTESELLDWFANQPNSKKKGEIERRKGVDQLYQIFVWRGGRPPRELKQLETADDLPAFFVAHDQGLRAKMHAPMKELDELKSSLPSSSTGNPDWSKDRRVTKLMRTIRAVYEREHLAGGKAAQPPVRVGGATGRFRRAVNAIASAVQQQQQPPPRRQAVAPRRRLATTLNDLRSARPSQQQPRGRAVTLQDLGEDE